jgi:hypothetical protein
MAEMVIDKAGKVSVDRELDVICIDGVKCSMELLPHCMNPDPMKFYRAVRNGETLTITAYDRAGVWAEIQSGKREELCASQEQLDELGHGIAYDAACSTIECNSLSVSEEEAAGEVDFYDVSPVVVDELAFGAVAEVLKYLGMRGLLDRHPDNPNRVRLRDEDEPIA